MRCMFDTVIFNRIVEKSLSVDFFRDHVEVFATHIQRDEIDATPELKKREQLKTVFLDLVPESSPGDEGPMLPTPSAVWEISDWDAAYWDSGDGLYDALKQELDKCNKKKKNNPKDALIGETALGNNLILVTNDCCLRKAVEKYGGKCLTFDEFLLSIQQ